jgi:glycogen debranching enzyme
VVSNTITIKDDYTFLVSDKAGELSFGPEGHGLYFQDTRYLSRLQLTLDGKAPQFLSYNTDYNLAATFQLSSSYVAQLRARDDEEITLTPAWRTVEHAVALTRKRFIRWGLVESLEFVNYHYTSVKISVALRMSADFADIFEVRGFPHHLQGIASRLEVIDQGRQIDFHCTVAGAKPRLMRFEADRQADRYEEVEVTSPLNNLTVPEVVLYYELELQPQKPLTINFGLLPEPEQANGKENSGGVGIAKFAKDFNAESAHMHEVFDEWRAVCTRIETGDFVTDKIFEISMLDLRSLMQREPQGLVVTAGLPWYFTLFGRDSLITSLQTLALNPQIAIDTLRTLAVYQATDFDDWRDSEPGKILHELRRGDMTLSGEMPHSPYYGSVDSTILFILCFAETLKWINDPAFFAELWPNVEKALQWCEKYGDTDGDGYIEFKRRSQRGILHQGWKDSDESMGGYTGPFPVQPVALVEVQGYYYAAKAALAEALRRYGNAEQVQLAVRLEKEAANLKAQFNRDYWWEEEGFFYQALDADKKPIKSITSNPGHCLWSGIIDEDKATRVVQRLMQPDMLCGWGVRTMSATDETYNPMSYHNGSVWPHDNSLLIAGLRRYGFNAEVVKVTEQLFAAATTFEDYRLPELYCGFSRAGAEERAPAAYPVSCSPQAWAAGTAVLILQSLLGLEPDAFNNRLNVAPILLPALNKLRLLNLRVGQNRLNLSFERDPQTSQINVIPIDLANKSDDVKSLENNPDKVKVNLRVATANQDVAKAG